MDQQTGMKEKRNLRIQIPLGILAILLFGAVIYYFNFYAFNFYARSRIGMEQPIPFSHRVHVNEMTGGK